MYILLKTYTSFQGSTLKISYYVRLTIHADLDIL
jgi:hypothetical protein